MSFSASSSARLTPTATAGRASGRATRKKIACVASPPACGRRRSGSRPASETSPASSGRRTGYSTKPSSSTQPVIERMSGRRKSRGLSMPEQRTQHRLDRPDRMQEVEIGVSDDVSRDGQRQQERPVERRGVPGSRRRSPARRCRCRGRPPATPTPARRSDVSSAASGSTYAKRCRQRSVDPREAATASATIGAQHQQPRRAAEPPPATAARGPDASAVRAGVRLVQLSNPTLSTSLLAAARWRAMSVSGRRSTLSVPRAADERMDRRASLHRVLEVGLRVNLLRLVRDEVLEEPDRSRRFGACFATAAPEMLTWVPPPSNVGRITLIARPTSAGPGRRRRSRIRPT